MFFFYSFKILEVSTLAVGFRRRTLAEFGHERHVFLVNLVASTAVVSRVWAAVAEGALRAAVAGDVTGAAALVAHDGVGDVGLVGTLPRLVRRGAAVGAARSELALAERAVEHGQLAQLHFAQVVLVLRHLHSSHPFTQPVVFDFGARVFTLR